MQDPPLPPGSAWLAKAWNEQFELGAVCAEVQTFPGDIPPPLLFSCNLIAQHVPFALACNRAQCHACSTAIVVLNACRTHPQHHSYCSYSLD